MTLIRMIFRKVCTPKEVATIDVCEEWNILMKTSRKIRKVNDPDYGIMYEIKCDTQNFQKNNSKMRDRHKKIFQKDEYVFVASDELVMSMTYEFINKLKLDKWTKLESDWLLKATKIINKDH